MCIRDRESLGIEKYDYLVVNDKLDDCVELVNDIIHSSDAVSYTHLQSLSM